MASGSQVEHLEQAVSSQAFNRVSPFFRSVHLPHLSCDAHFASPCTFEPISFHHENCFKHLGSVFTHSRKKHICGDPIAQSRREPLPRQASRRSKPRAHAPQ